MLELKKLILLILATNLVYNPAVSADAYSRVVDLSLIPFDKVHLQRNYFNINYKYSSVDNNPERISVINKVILDTTDIVFDFAQKRELSLVRCNHDHFINIYEINSSDLNNNDIFPRAKYYPNATRIYGIWEPIENNDAIVIAHLDDDALFEDILSHEIAHYWYNRLNLSKVTSLTHEEFALLIENKHKRYHK